MAEIKFSHLSNHPENFGLEQFTGQTHHQLQLQPMEWVTGWNEMLQIANFHEGPDVSEIGNTWLGSLVGMNAARPFKLSEIARLGGVESFLPVVWQANKIYGQDQVFAIPWYTGIRLIAYRRDIFAEAGVPEEGAFATVEAMQDTLERLQAAGVSVPWVMNTEGLNFHVMAPWVWGAGGHFRSLDRRHLELNNPHTIQGMKDYFQLVKYLAPEVRGLDYWPSAAVLASGKAAAGLVENSFVHTLQYHTDIAPGLADLLGFAKVPGVPYVGSVSLVIWRHSLHDEAALDWIKHLVSTDQQMKLFIKNGNLPTRTTAMVPTLFYKEDLYQVCYDSLRTGRSFPSSPFWAAIETRLNTLIRRMWLDLYADPDFDLDKEIAARLQSLTDRLEKTLLANNS